MVVVVVDAQKLITNEKLFQFDLFVHHVKELIRMAREHKVEVIYVRHDDGIGSELTPGTSGYEIFDQFQPGKDEKIFDKTVNSIFKDSGMLEYLHGEKEIIIVGLLVLVVMMNSAISRQIWAELRSSMPSRAEERLAVDTSRRRRNS